MPTLDDLINAIPAHAPNREIALHYLGGRWFVAAVNPCIHVLLGESNGVVETEGETLEEAIELAIQELQTLKDNPDAFEDCDT